MPWPETNPMDQRRRFIKDWLTREWNMTELCRHYGICRPTGYKWRDRHERHGFENLAELSRQPHSHPNATPKELQDAIIAERQKRPYWGPRKLLHRLMRTDPRLPWPAASTIGEILDRNGLIARRPKRHRVAAYQGPTYNSLNPNDVWAMDFKGWFVTGSGIRIDPFTVSDVASRFLIRCRRVVSTHYASIRAQLTVAFIEKGLPLVMRSDNGPPFASVGLAGLSRLSVWLIRLGIVPERIKPGRPDQNGVHERMHRTLKDVTANPPRASVGAQDEAFERFMHEFNYERPHEALEMRTPSEVYQPSSRQFPSRLPELVYPSGMITRQLTDTGSLYWANRKIYIAAALGDERIGLSQIAEEYWEVYFGALCLGVIGRNSIRVTPSRSIRV